MARLKVEVSVTIMVTLDIEAPGWELGYPLSHDDQQQAYDQIPKQLDLASALDIDPEDYHIVEVIRASEVVVPKVRATQHEEEW